MAFTRLQWGSAILLALALASWVIALGGLGSINWLVCSNSLTSLPAGGTLADVATAVAAQTKDIPLCSRTWSWEWFTLFWQFAIIASALVVSVIPNRLERSRMPIAIYLAIAVVIMMVALNDDIRMVWSFWDEKKMFSEWEGVAQKLYMSAAALAAGWILNIIFNIIWIGFTLDFEVKKKNEGAPITGDVEAAAATRK